MKRTNELLYEVINNRLEQTKTGCEEDGKIFKEAMEAYDRHLELVKIENAKLKVEEELEVRKMEAENAKIEAEKELKLKRREATTNSIIKGAEIIGVIIVTPIIAYKTKKAFAEMMCYFEKEYTFTTMPGRSISSWFKFKD
jgi:hypothetical protein